MLQYLMAEFSLMWLLFLGVFMVVVSSGVLAVSQWRQFPPQGQYLILLSYTLAFWVASAWTGRRENLRLTDYMLKITTLLIIPVNFWMIDQLKLWTSGLGLALAAIAASLLTAIIIRLFNWSPPCPAFYRFDERRDIRRPVKNRVCYRRSKHKIEGN